MNKFIKKHIRDVVAGVFYVTALVVIVVITAVSTV